MATLFFYLAVISSLPLLSPSRVQADAVDGLQWEVLSRSNFSSQIRLHPNIILLVTLPWSGESRFLMKDLADRIAREQEEYGSPKLMIFYRNKERMLADAIGATDDITIMFFYHSFPYKYQGKLRSQNILSSLKYLISHPSEHLPIQPLNTQKDLKLFLQSTDKAVLVLEFCGWTHYILANGGNIGTSNDLESNRSLAAQWKKEQAIENEKMTCDAQNGFNGFPWLEEFNWVSQSDSNNSFKHEVSCSSEKFQQFNTFSTKFVKVAREYFLPSERVRFGLVTNKSLLLDQEHSSSWLLSFDVVDSDSWLMAVHFSGCPTCSLFLRGEDGLKSAIDMQNPIVTELGDDSHDPVLPANKPSVLLFIDRSSDSLVDRRKSKGAFDAFRSLAFQYHKHNGTDSKFSYETHPQSKSFLVHQNKKLPSASRKVVFKDKVTIRVLDEGKKVTLDKDSPGLQGDSLREILAYVLKGGNGVKLSSLAKQAGFQLLSEDFDVEALDALPTQTQKDLKSDQSENELPGEANNDFHDDEVTSVDSLFLEDDEPRKTTHSDKSSQHATFDTAKQPSGEPVHLHEEFPFEGFSGSFFFSDGGYSLLKALTGGLKIPSVVMIDPVKQKHYILNEETDFSLSSLSDFVNGFVNGSLIPYQKSESGLKAPDRVPSPPFVNLDFHVADSIPQLVSDTFNELVIGINQSDNLAWKKDVMVLFSNSWCGFCQRMELVVREVYKVFKRYATMLNPDTFGDTMSRLPQFYLIDCTLNECSLILRSIAQKENYPHLLLFPAESKVAVSYEGDIAVSAIIKFVVDYGNKVRDLVKEKGIWTGVIREIQMKAPHEDVEALTQIEERTPEDKKEGSHFDLESLSEKDTHPDDIFEDTIPEGKKEDSLSGIKSLFQCDQNDVDKKEDSYLDEVSLDELDEHDEVLLEHMTPEEEFRYNRRKTNSRVLVDPTQLGVGSLLIATEKLLKVPPIDNSVVLIVNAHKQTGFQGVIINKHLSWNLFENVEEGLEELLKDARLSLGGYLMQEGWPLIASTREKSSNNDYPQVLPGVYFLDQRDTIREIHGLESRKQSATNYWFFFGYSSWGYDQLFREINRGDWNVSDDFYVRINWPWPRV